LTSAEQDQWYVDSGYDINNPYRFKWFTYMCVAPAGGTYTLTRPNELRTSYASREDGILLDGSLDPAYNSMFKDVAENWMDNPYQGQTLRSVVGSKVNDGPYTAAFLGDIEMPWRTIVYGILDVSASCGAGETLQALPIVDSNDVAITSKSFVITEQLKVEVSGDYFLVNTVGASIGVTGAPVSPPGFNAALWGLTTVADNTPPPPPAPPAPPAPTQQSKVSGVSVELVRVDSSAIVILNGTFVENVANISVNGIPLKPSDWLQSANLVRIVLPAGSAGKNLIQIFNGSVPLLPIQSIEVLVPTPSEKVPNPPTPAATNPPTPEVKPTPNPTRSVQILKVGTIFNATDSSVVSKSSKIYLQTIASKIQASNTSVVYVDGHADSRGGTDNVKLSQERAKAVANLLRPLVTGKKIVIRWYGSSKPIAPGNSAADLAKNRRVEIYAK
jgi:outer membrane protein OmpA-like peptidoglycan-associated protein